MSGSRFSTKFYSSLLFFYCMFFSRRGRDIFFRYLYNYALVMITVIRWECHDLHFSSSRSSSSSSSSRCRRCAANQGHDWACGEEQDNSVSMLVEIRCVVQNVCKTKGHVGWAQEARTYTVVAGLLFISYFEVDVRALRIALQLDYCTVVAV